MTLTTSKTGKKYSFKVKAYRTSSGKTVYSTAYSQTKKATPKLSKVKGVKVKKNTKKRTIKVSWKKVKGASKYVVYQKTGKGKYKKVKTTSSKSYTAKKLKQGTTYRYKVRAYKTVDKKKTYSSYSSVKKAKL